MDTFRLVRLSNFFKIALLILFGAVVFFAIRDCRDDPELKKKDAEIKLIKEENSRIQEELAKKIEARDSEISKLEERISERDETISKLEPVVKETDKREEELRQEYETSIIQGKESGELLLLANKRIENFQIQVFTLKTQKDMQALEIVDLKLALELSKQNFSDMELKYQKERALRVAVEGAYELSKRRIKRISLFGNLKGIGGIAIGALTGYMIAK